MAEVVYLAEMKGREVFSGAACVMGVFDGMHKGHRFLIDQALADARSSRSRSIAITFERDPDELLSPRSLDKLMTNEERIESLLESGVDAVAILPSTLPFFKLEPAEFLEWAFAGESPRSLHVGADFRFGFRASGTVDDLRRWAAPRGTKVHGHDLLMFQGKPISATRIRRLIAEGEAARAASML